MPEHSVATEAIIWDLDGTIIDSFEIYETLIGEIAPVLGLAVPTSEELANNYHGPLLDSIHHSFGSVMNDEELNGALSLFLEKQIGHYEAIEDHLLEDALVLATRATQKGIKQVIVTNRDHEGRGSASPRNIVTNSSLKDHIHEVICGDEGNGFRKPDPKVLGDLLTRWEVDPAHVLVVGDQHVDAQLAINLGARAVIVSRDGSEFAHADKLIEGWQDHVRVVSSLKDVQL